MAYEIIEDFKSYRRSQHQRVLLIDHEGLFTGPEIGEEWDYEPDPDFDFSGASYQQMKDLVSVLPSEFTEFAVMMPDKENQTYKNFTFAQREYLRQVYDTPSKRTLLKCGRQVEKSTMLGNKLLSYSCIVSALNSLYVSPTNQQSKVFSQDRLKEPIETSAFLKSWTTTKLSDNVFLKKFINRSQITLRYAFMNADRCRGIPADIICFDKNTQVLTRNGWKLVTEISETDELADVNDRGEVEWNKPYNIFSKKYTGEIISFNHSRMNLRVTSDHQMVVNFKVKPGIARDDSYVFSDAGTLAKTSTMGFKMTCGATWPGVAPANRILDGIPSAHGKNRRSLSLNYQDFALLTGWYISEGHVQRYSDGKYCSPVISQNASRYLDEIVQTVERLGISYRVHKDPRSDVRHVVINSAILGKYYSQLGKSRDKHIPREFFEHPSLLGNVLRGIYLGDACYHQGEEWWQGTLKTRSKRLAEDVQEAWLRANRPAVIHTRMFVPAHQDNPNYDSMAPEPMYEVCAYKKDYFIFWRSEFESKQRVITESVSDEDVYCFTIKNHRPIVKGGFGSQPVITGQCMDELQDLLTDNIPVIEECASHSVLTINGEVHKGGIFMYAGTPKSLDNTIEVYWNQYSTQNEWVVPCHNHSMFTGSGQLTKVHWNILTEDHIGLKSIICDRCGGPINPVDPIAQWAALNPGIIKEIPKPYDGYRIPQLMVPWISHEDILQKQKTYPRDRFYNEVLGLSYDSGTRPLTQQDVIDNCSQYLQLDEPSLEKIRNHLGGAHSVYAGIDWGCHDEETRILTKRGFQHFRDLTDSDLVAQWDPDSRDMTFVKPEARTVRDWDKPLYHFEGKGLDMMLTDTHRMRVGVKSGSERVWKTEPCGETIKRAGSVLFAGHVDWVGTPQETFVLPEQLVSSGYSGHPQVVFNMDDWLEFLGYYLSEGGLCFDGDRPSCLKMSQRETVNPGSTDKIRSCLVRLFSDYLSEFPNEKTGDVNWTLYGKHLWKWVLENVGERGHLKRIPRQFLDLPKEQLRILFDAMMLGDGSTDSREGNDNGYYGSTSKGLCEDFQEMCIRLGLRSTLSLHKPAEGNRKARWRLSWSTGRDFQFNDPKAHVKEIPYNGKVYCCKVPKGYIVTERNGRIAYQGNTGEGSFTVLTLASYIDGKFQVFYYRRFEGRESDPNTMMDEVFQTITKWGVKRIGVDYGGGFWPNDKLTQRFGMLRVAKYQYSTPTDKVRWEDGLKRFLVNRTEVMSDVFNAIKRRDVFRFPNWGQFKNPFGSDFLNIFAEYNEQRRQIEYKKSPGTTDDSFHSTLLCFLVSMLDHPRPDIIAPNLHPKGSAKS